MSRLAGVVGIVGVAVQQLRYDRTRAVLVVLGIALAAFAVMVLASVGLGVVETGQAKFDQSGRDLWITGGPVSLGPGTSGGLGSGITDAHRLRDELADREDVDTVAALAFRTVYVSNDSRRFETVIGAGAPAVDTAVRITEGRGFTGGDSHYAGGSYDGPMTREVVIDPRTASLLDVGVNDTVYVGGTVRSAGENAFRVVGVSPTFSNFLGSPTVVLHLSELQAVTGTTGTDAATLVTVDLVEGADVARAEREIGAQYPQYDVRTNREQLESTLRDQAVVIASGTSLVVFATVAGVAVTLNVLVSYVYRRRRELAALKALGLSTRTLVAVTLVQALGLGVLGGALGTVLTVLSVPVLNAIAAALVGFEGVVSLRGEVLLTGVGLAVVTSALAGAVASARVGRVDPLELLE
ncbi:MAG: ABC transporter permease [Haloarculaceae archaeon]